MATIDVLAPSNWSSTFCGAIDTYSEGGCGWTGASYHSEGKILLSGWLTDLGTRVSRVNFNANFTKHFNWDTSLPSLVVSISGNYTTINPESQTYVDIPAYDETIPGLYYSVKFESTVGWTPYAYDWDPSIGEEGGMHLMYLLDLYALSFTYTNSAPPFLWRDYRNTRESISE